MKVIFMGTPELARECLRAVYEKDGVDVAAVVTRPDKQKGRGMKLVSSPVKEFAEEHGIPVYQPKTLKDGAFAEVLDEIKPELIIVAAYGNILPPYVIEYPKYGCVNAHGSILPKYRGASPIQRAIIDGETETGITAMYMDNGLDTGDIIEIYRCEIAPEDDFGTVHDKLAVLAGKAMCDVIDKIEAGTVTRTKQNDAESCYAAKIEKEDTVIDFTKSAKDIVNLIRGLSPAPCAMTTQNGSILKLTDASVTSEINEDISAYARSGVGTVVSLSPKGEGRITISCGDGFVSVRGVIPEGKKRMSAGDYIRGRKIACGDVLGK